MKGYVSQIETMGLLDGPGIRAVIFMQGCPLRCLFCHNPEMWELKKTTLEYSAEDLLKLVKKYKSYYGNTGGVTFSGGEPLMQSKFLKESIELLKKENISVALDTSGSIYNDDTIKIIEMVDLVILDIKGIDEESYKFMTGCSIEVFNKFLKILEEKNKPLWIRTVIVPGINDNLEYIQKLGKYIKKIKNVQKVELLPYHKMGDVKYKNLKITNPLESTKEMDYNECSLLENKLNELLNKEVVNK